MTGQQTPGHSKQHMQEQKQGSATYDTGSRSIDVGIKMLSPPGTTLCNDNTVLPREVCSQRIFIFGTAFLQKASNHKYGDNAQHR